MEVNGTSSIKENKDVSDITYVKGHHWIYSNGNALCWDVSEVFPTCVRSPDRFPGYPEFFSLRTMGKDHSQ